MVQNLLDHLLIMSLNKKKYFLYVSVLTYLLVIGILDYMTSLKLKTEGIYVAAQIDRVSKSNMVKNYVYYTFYHSGKPFQGSCTLFTWEENVNKGDYYLLVFLKGKEHINYLFNETPLPNNDSIHTNIEKFIPNKVRINFLDL